MSESTLQEKFRRIAQLASRAEPYIQEPRTVFGPGYSDRCVLEFLAAVRELPADVREFLRLEE